MKYGFVILTGGMGSRLFPLTKEFPKPYLPIYFDEDKVVRMIDIPLEFCEKNGIPAYVNIGYMGDKFDYLRENKNVKLIRTDVRNIFEAILDSLYELEKDGVTHYSVYAGDFLIPDYVILKMMKYMMLHKKVMLCSKKSDYSKIQVEGDDELTDLTFYIKTVEDGIRNLSNLTNPDDVWNNDGLGDIKKIVTDVNNIDMGIPCTYYEAVRKLNKDKINKNGNIVFPNAKINGESKNIIALPNSDSSGIILENAIVPEDAKISSLDEVLLVDDINSNHFGKIKIKDFGGNSCN